MRIIPDLSGGVLPLAEALDRFPSGLVLYHRVSSWGQAGSGKCNLEVKTSAVVDAVRNIAPGRLRRISRGVEEGKMSKPRPKLKEAAEYAARRGLILVASDLSRLIRSEAYDRQSNLEAVPTPEEFAALREFTLGVPLATVADPGMPESDRMSLAVRRTGKAGRKRTIDGEMAARIFADLGCLFLNGMGQWRWERPIRKVAEFFGVSTTAIGRAAEMLSPNGKTWRSEAIALAEKRGFLKIQPNGAIVPLVEPRNSSRGWYGKRGRPPKWVISGGR